MTMSKEELAIEISNQVGQRLGEIVQSPEFKTAVVNITQKETETGAGAGIPKSLTKVPIFDPTVGNWDSHLLALEIFYDLSSIKEDLVKKRLLYLSLAPNIRDRALNVSPVSEKARAESYEQYTHTLGELYSPISESPLAKQEFKVRIQGAGESVQSYFSAKLSLFRRAYGSSADEQFLVSPFIDGLYSVKVKEEVFRRQPVDGSQCLNYAAQGVGMCRMLLPSNPSKHQLAGLVSSSGSYMTERGFALKSGGESKGEAMDTSHMDEEVGAVESGSGSGYWIDEEGIYNITEEDDYEEEEFYPETQTELSYWEDELSQLSPSGGCFHCGLEGHLKRDCFRRSKGLPRTAKGRFVSNQANRRGGRGFRGSRAQYGTPRRGFGGRGRSSGRGTFAPRRNSPWTQAQRFNSYGTPRSSSIPSTTVSGVEPEPSREEIQEGTQDF